MKLIQISFDERLLAKLDADPEVAREGRSAVLRKAAFDYLRRKRRKEISDAYERAYARGVSHELDGWANGGTWPDE